MLSRLENALNHINVAMVFVDAEWRCIFENDRTKRFLAPAGAQLIGKNLWDALPQISGTSIEQYFRAAMEQKTNREFIYTDSYGRTFEISAYPNPDGLAIFARDITNERAAQSQHRLLEAAVSHQGDMLLITEAEPIEGPDGPKIVYVNDAFVRHTGYSREEAIGATPRILQGPGTQREDLDQIRRALERGAPIRCELLNYTKSGDSMWVELDIAAPLTDEHGRRTHFVSVQRDITERKKAEEAMRLSEQRFRLLAQSSHDAIWDHDLNSKETWWNEGLDTFGYRAGDVGYGAFRWADHIHPGDKDRVLASFQQFRESEVDEWTEDYRFRDANDSIRFVIGRAFTIRDEQGAPARMIGSMRDDTERRLMEDRVRQSQKLEAIGQLTGGIAHDSNNLLSIILTNAEMLLDDLIDEQSPLSEEVELIIRTARRGAELNNRLLTIARKQPLDPKPSDVTQLIKDMHALIRRSLPANINIDLAPARSPHWIKIDPVQLEVALLNLAINARDAMPQGGQLTIEAASKIIGYSSIPSFPELTPGEYVTIDVSDTGVGMTPEILDRAFEPFFTTKDVNKGSGLGLAMVYGFVRQSGGTVRIDSQPGEGTSVRLYFPRLKSVEKPKISQRKEIIGGTERILLVEDLDSVRDTVTKQLERLGYTVLVAGCGAEALTLLAEKPQIDLLFTDIVMPGGMNGIELARCVQAQRPDIRILFASGYSEDAFDGENWPQLSRHLIRKPFGQKVLASAVRRSLDSPPSRVS